MTSSDSAASPASISTLGILRPPRQPFSRPKASDPVIKHPPPSRRQVRDLKFLAAFSNGPRSTRDPWPARVWSPPGGRTAEEKQVRRELQVTARNARFQQCGA